MSATDDISSSKEEDDLLNEDLVHQNTKNVSGINISNEDSSITPDTSENIAKLTDDAALGLSEIINNESGDKITCTADSVVKPLILETDENGDNAPIDKAAEIKTQDSYQSGLKESSVTIEEKVAPTNVEKTEIRTEKVNKDDEILEEDELELRWDEDDGVTSVFDNATESCDANRKDGLEVKSLEDAEQNVEEITDKQLTIKTQSISEVNIQITDSIAEPAISEETINKDDELAVEENLLEEPEITTENSGNVDVSMEYTEDELLKDDQPENSEMMEVDTTDKDVVVSETIKISNDTNITQENYSKPDETKVDDKPNDDLENDTVLNDENINESDSATKEISETIAVKKTIDDLNLSSDSQELNLLMDVESGDISADSSRTPFKIGHGLRKPDVMLEIPTLPAIYINDALDSPTYTQIDDGILLDDQVINSMEDDSSPNTIFANKDEQPMLPAIDENDALDSPTYTQNDDGILMDDQVINNMEDDSLADSRTNTVVANKDDIDQIMDEKTAVVETTVESIKITESSNDVLEEADGKEGKDDLEAHSSEVNTEAIAPKVDEAQPSTSTAFPKMTPDTSDEVPEMTDSLGLLAESFRVRDDDDDQDDDDGDADDDDDSDQDDSSNHMTAEHSEDSNAPQSENEQMKNELDIDEKETEELGDDIDEKETEELGDDIEDRDAEDREAEVNQCEEDNIDDFEAMEEDDGCQYENTAKEGEECEGGDDENDDDDDGQVLPAIIGVSSEATTKIDKGNKATDEEDKLDKTVESQVNIKQEETVQSENDKTQEETLETQSKEIAQNVEDDLKSKDAVKAEKEVSSETKDAGKTDTKVAVQRKDPIKKEKEDSTQPKDTVKTEKEASIQPKDAAKKEKGDSIQPKRAEKEKEVTTKPKESATAEEVTEEVADDERPSSRASSNDDCIEQTVEIETVKVSDDDDDDEPAETTQKETNNTATSEQLEKYLLNKEVELEKITLKDTTIVEKSAVENTEAEKTTEAVKKSELEKTRTTEKESEKIPEVENATIDLTPPDQADSAGSQTVDTGTSKSSPSKLKNLTVSSVLNTNVLSIVELGESSSEDDIQEVEKEQEHTLSYLQQLLEAKPVPPKIPSSSSLPQKTPESSTKTQESAPKPSSKDVTSVNIPTGIDIMSTSGAGGNRSQIVTKEGEVVISGVAKPPPQKPARLNTSEVTIKTASCSEQTLIIPEAKAKEQAIPAATKPKLSLEIFSLDSDEEDAPAKAAKPTATADTKRVTPKKKRRKCMNSACSSGLTVMQAADNATVAYYDAMKKKKPVVCQVCAQAVLDRKQNLVDGIKNFTPLLQLEMTTISQDLVEILDSESEDEEPQPQEPQPKETIGEEAAKFLEENLTDLLNESWKKYKLDDRLKETQDELNEEILKLEEESKEINQMLVECQRATDKLRSDLYATFEYRVQEMPPLLIYETPEFSYIGPEADNAVPANVATESKLVSAKRKMLSNNEPQAKRPAIPLGYAPLDDSKLKVQENKSIDIKADDDKDISVVKLSAESAPADLPPPGELSRPALRVGMQVYAMKNAFGPWFMGKVIEIMPKSSNPVSTANFTMCRIKFDHKVKNNGKVLPARCIAYAQPADVRMTIGTRLIALFKDSNKRESYYSGVVAEIPNPVNNYRYLVFFDDGYAQYVSHSYTRLVCECSPLVWEEVHPLSREFVREYLMAYPERPMVRLHEGQHLKTEWDGKWWSSRVNKVDASLAQVVFIGDGRREWIYRGSTRLAPLYLELRAAERHRPRPMPRSTQPRSNTMPYVEYTRSDEQANKAQESQSIESRVALTAQQQNEELRRQRAVAKKSTSLAAAPAPPPHAPPAPRSNLDALTSRVVYYTPKNAVRPYKLVPHTCSPKCKRSDLLTLKELRTYNPLAKPLLSGWERQIVRYRGQKGVMYRAPCGRRVRSLAELHRYLRATASELPVDLFDFHAATHCLAEFVLNKCLVGKKDLSHGKENVPVPCVNYYDDSLPEFCSYNTERTPTSGVPLNLDPEFLCGCDCTDDCADKSKCACWKMTLEGARTIGLDVNNVGYEYKRLPEPLPSGIYECNSRCKCKQTCLNRVAQHPLQLKLQVFKTLNRGWGIRALNDVPKGAFLCVYAGNLLTDATANLDGLNEGDEYLAELDYIEVVEQMKEGYEEEVAEPDKKLDKKEGAKQEDSGAEPSSSSEEDDNASKTDKEDDDFRPGCVSLGVMDFNKRLRKRSKKKEAKDEKEAEKENKTSEKNPDEDCITISDDDEVREPSRFTAKPGMGGNDFISKYRSVRTLFGEDEACYIMDAKVQGNIGRYLNHSCSPNVFVQNVFVDTHDPRFPWVAFFALSHIKAGMELTWNYNYDIGSVPGKVLYCYCEAPNCRGRLL